MKIISPKSFAQIFVHTRNCVESAIRLGVSPFQAKAEGVRLVCDRRVRREIKKLDNSDEQNLSYVKTGLSRLAFGQVNDVVSILFDEEPIPEKISQADLFNVSEIKRVKGGGVEVKFFDRQKALERLIELDSELHRHNGAEEFLQAVVGNSQADLTPLKEDDEESGDIT